jgi:hypothetical protein
MPSPSLTSPSGWIPPSRTKTATTMNRAVWLGFVAGVEGRDGGGRAGVECPDCSRAPPLLSMGTQQVEVGPTTVTRRRLTGSPNTGSLELLRDYNYITRKLIVWMCITKKNEMPICLHENITMTSFRTERSPLEFQMSLLISIAVMYIAPIIKPAIARKNHII